MFACVRAVMLGCCLLVALSIYGAEYLGKVAFVKADGLWVQDFPDGKPCQVASGKVSDPNFSNSGRWVLCGDEALSSVVAISVDHPQTPPHCLNGENFCWSPCGDELAYTRGCSGIHLTRAGSWKEFTVLRGTRNTTNTDSIFPGAIGELCWSPDGKRLAYIIWRKPRRKYADNNWDAYGEIHVINGNGSGDRIVLRDTPYGSHLLGLSWTPDGRYLLYNREAVQSASILADGIPLYALALSGGKPRLISQRTFCNAPSYACSPDGREIAISEGEGRETWVNRQLKITTLRSGASNPWTLTSYSAICPAWSPQGGILAYVEGPAGQVPDGDASRALLAQRHIELQLFRAGAGIGVANDTVDRQEYPQWSADGTHLLFIRITPAGAASLWECISQTDQARQLVPAIVSTNREDTQWDGYYGNVQWSRLLTYWRGQRIATPAIVQHGTLFLSGRTLQEVVEAFGGHLGLQGQRADIITLHGITHRYIFARNTTTADPTSKRCWRRYGIVCSLRQLAQDFSLQLSWNAPAAEAVVNDTRGSRIVIIHASGSRYRMPWPPWRS